MKKITFCSIIILMLTCCNQGVWKHVGVYPTYRPKHPRFKILKEPFIENNLIDTNHFYLYIHKSYYEGSNHIGGYGFFGNGQIINTGCEESQMNIVLSNTNSFNTAPKVGYYTTEGNKIKLEYFVPSEGGEYETKQGIIKKDTIIFMEIIRGGASLVSKEVRSDTLIKSPWVLR